jgi:hypothetical protein
MRPHLSGLVTRACLVAGDHKPSTLECDAMRSRLCGLVTRACLMAGYAWHVASSRELLILLLDDAFVAPPLQIAIEVVG